MPHVGYSDLEVESTYQQIDDILAKTRAARHFALLGGDWNAEVGRRQPGEEGSAVGANGEGVRNPRGDLLAKWATHSNLKLENTCFRKTWDNTWTHVQNGRSRIIDYILVDKCFL
eukprot:560190-Karenia_brevis.AAC.1